MCHWEFQQIYLQILSSIICIIQQKSMCCFPVRRGEQRGSNKFLYLQISRVPSLPLHHPTQFLCLLLSSLQSLVMTASVKLDTVDTAICRCRCKNTSFLCSQKVLCTRIFHLQLFCILKALIGQFPGHYSHKTYSDSDELTSLTGPYTIICKRSTMPLDCYSLSTYSIIILSILKLDILYKM